MGFVLKRYSILSFGVIVAEVVLLYLFLKPIKKMDTVPKTYEEIVLINDFFPSAVLRSLAESKSNQTPSYPSQDIPLMEKKFIDLHLVNVKKTDSSIRVDLKYATEDNFLHKNLYGDLKNCYLQKEIAEKLGTAQKILKEKYPFYSLIIYDGVRPLSIQQKMWDEMDVPEKSKDNYVSDPAVGSLHNFGCAVDVSIINEEGWEMDMGTPYDYFGELGHPVAEQKMLEAGKLSWRQIENRKLLREVMTKAGFTGITTEWWHFNGTSLKRASEKYQIVN